MKKSFKFLSYALILISLSGCFSMKSHSVLDKTPTGEWVNPYQGPQAKIAVNDFELKTSGVDVQISQALKEYLVNILNSTKRFAIVAPQDADLIISVGIVEFVPENSGGKAGLAGGGSSASSFMGGLLGEVLNKANMQLNLRIVDRVSLEVISSRDIQSQVVGNPGKKIKFPQDKVFRNGLSDYTGTPMNKVIHDCIVESGRFIVQNVPQNYYKE
ncbi:MAG TPA: CsgG/HfaB family protein [Candidatus Omnitrophota bacterium]|nr:CsgG/HfaB family protein [Candidatus Omnitrophota bacterium]